MLKKYVYVAIACVYAGIIFYLSSLSSPPNPIKAEFLFQLYRLMKNAGVEFLAYPFYFAYRYPDKFVHMVLYMGFGFTLNPALRNTVGKHTELYSLAVGVSYGALDEFHQSFVPYRSASAADLLADFFGLLISQVIIFTVMYVKSIKGKAERGE